MSNNMDYGKMPPQAIDLEEAVLGALLLEKDSYYRICDLLTIECFYTESHKKIYCAINDLINNNSPVDILTVTEQLRNKQGLEEVGGPFYISQLTIKIASGANIEYHARIVKEKFIQRELIRISTEIQTLAYDNSIDVGDLIEFSEKEYFKIFQESYSKTAVHISQPIIEIVKDIEKIKESDGKLLGIPSGLNTLDKIIQGWQDSDLIILAARPSIGKSAMALKFGRFAADSGYSVCLFSLEMSIKKLCVRILAQDIDYTPTEIRSGKVNNWEQIEQSLFKYEKIPFYIDDTAGMRISELKSKCRNVKLKFGIDLIIIDYLQLMLGEKGKSNREAEISEISRGLKLIAKELDVPIIALSQLNREVERGGGDKKPQLHNLRESGAIEQDADIVMFLYRPEVYGIDTINDSGFAIDCKGWGQILIAKNRDGAIGKVDFYCNEAMTNITDQKIQVNEPF